MIQSRIDKKKIGFIFSGVLTVNDFLMVVVSFFLSYWFRFHSGLFSTPLGIPSIRQYVLPILFIGTVFIIILNSFGLYSGYGKRFIDQFFLIFKGSIITLLLLFAGTFFYRGVSYSRSLILIFWISLNVFVSISRKCLDLFYLKRIFPRHQKRIMVVGSAKSIDKLSKLFDPEARYGKLLGVIVTRRQHALPEGIPCLGTLDDYSRILRQAEPDEIILADLEVPRRRVIKMILEAEKEMVTFKIMADLLEIMVHQFELENINGLNLVKFKESPLNHAYNRALKRAVDLLGASLGLIIFSPLLLVIGLLIKVDSKGRILFAQERMSEDGSLFKIYKFRTMYEGAENQSGPVFTKRGDERCTRIGRFLRRYNIDELPQLFNVLKGEMSLVGPRPERPHFVNQFKEDIPRYMSRHHIKSGVTGWAQVNGLRQDSSIEERVKYDLYYLENWSILFDFKIIFMSLFAIKNAY